MTSSEHRRRPLPLLVFAAVLALSTSSFAQSGVPTAADLESARALFKQGKELRAQGQPEAALEKFKAAHAYGQTPITGLELGRTHYQLKHYIDAREVLLAVGYLKIAADETANSAKARLEAKELAAEILPLLASVEARVGKAPGTKVTIDGAEVPVISGVVERTVDPGEHEIVVHVDGNADVSQTIRVVDGEHKVVDLAPQVPVSAAPPPVVAVTPTPAPVETVAADPGTLSPLVYIGFGTAAAGAIVGGITGAMALSASGKADELCGAGSSHECESSAARDAAEAKRKDGQTLATVSTVSFVIVGVGAAAGIVGLFLPRSTAKPNGNATLTPVFGLGYAGLGGRF